MHAYVFIHVYVYIHICFCIFSSHELSSCLLQAPDSEAPQENLPKRVLPEFFDPQFSTQKYRHALKVNQMCTHQKAFKSGIPEVKTCNKQFDLMCTSQESTTALMGTNLHEVQRRVWEMRYDLFLCLSPIMLGRPINSDMLIPSNGKINSRLVKKKEGERVEEKRREIEVQEELAQAQHVEKQRAEDDRQDWLAERQKEWDSERLRARESESKQRVERETQENDVYLAICEFLEPLTESISDQIEASFSLAHAAKERESQHAIAREYFSVKDAQRFAVGEECVERSRIMIIKMEGQINALTNQVAEQKKVIADQTRASRVVESNAMTVFMSQQVYSHTYIHIRRHTLYSYA